MGTIEANTVMLQVLGVLLLAAVWTFITIQAALNDPHRREMNEEWFRQFHAFISARYRDGELNWRAAGLERHFYRPPRPPQA
jgi:hypothetical protein